MTETELFSTREIARVLHVHPSTVRLWLRRGVVRGHKVGKLWRISANELARLRGESPRQ